MEKPMSQPGPVWGTTRRHLINSLLYLYLISARAALVDDDSIQKEGVPGLVE